MKTRQQDHPPAARIRFLSPALRARAALSATLRGQPGPALRRQKPETIPEKELERATLPL